VLDLGLRCVQIFTVCSVDSGLRSLCHAIKFVYPRTVLKHCIWKAKTLYLSAPLV